MPTTRGDRLVVDFRQAKDRLRTQAEDPRLELCQVRQQGRIVDAMQAIDRSGLMIALVVDAHGRLVGIVTDGDIRRALLGGAGLDSPLAPHVERSFTSTHPGATRTEVLDLMQARQIRQIPVVGSDGQVRGLHLMDELIGSAERPNWAVIMAGGKGTRLRPLTQHLPKPMIPVAGRPILERLVLHLVGHGFRRIFLAINYLGGVVEKHFADGSSLGCRIEYLREEQPLGTGGALSLLPERPLQPLVVMNGDLVTQVNLHDMLELHGAGPQVATVGVRKYFHTVPYGCLEIREDRVTALVEKPCLEQIVNTGIYVLDPALVAEVPAGREYAITTLIQFCLEQDRPVAAYELEDDWIDVGQREQLRQAQGVAA